MREELQEVIERASSPDFETQQKAILQLALILERKNRDDIGSQGLYESVLSPTLLQLKTILDDGEERQLVLELCELIRTERMSLSMFWAISKVSSESGLEPLLNLLATYPKELDELATRQALIALDNFILFQVDYNHAFSHLTKSKGLTQIINTGQKSNDPNLVELAEQVEHKVAYLDGKL